MGLIVPGIVLAGGQSTRMGRPKGLLPIGAEGDTFVSRVIRVLRAGGVDDVVVVVAGEAAAIEDALARETSPPRLVVNPEPALGQLSSLLVGLAAVDHPGVGATLVTLVDVPLVSAETVRALLTAYQRTRAPIVRPQRGGRHGHPVVFDRSLFAELRRADMHVGTKAVIRSHHAKIVDVDVDDEGAFLDIDTPDDYERVFGQPVPEEPRT